MPNFQGAVNQVLDQAGLYSSLAGGPQDLKERMRLGKEEKALNKQIEAATSSGKPLRPEVEEDLEERSKDVARRKFELKPSEKTYEEYAKQLPIKTPPDDPETVHEERMRGIDDEARRKAEYDYFYKQAYNQELSRIDKMSQAMDRIGRQSEAKKTQKRNFMTYLAQQPTSLGGTVGDLPSDLQKQIASQYGKNERRTMMNRMDREANNGKQK